MAAQTEGDAPGATGLGAGGAKNSGHSAPHHQANGFPAGQAAGKFGPSWIKLQLSPSAIASWAPMWAGVPPGRSRRCGSRPAGHRPGGARAVRVLRRPSDGPSRAAAAGQQPAGRLTADGITAGDHRAGSAQDPAAATTRGGPAKAAKAAPSQSNSTRSSSASDAKNCPPQSWRRASARLPRETPSSPTGPATHPGALTARQLALGDGISKGRDHLRSSGRAPRAKARPNWTAFACWYGLPAAAVGARLTGGRRAPDETGRAARLNLSQPPGGQADWQAVKNAVVRHPIDSRAFRCKLAQIESRRCNAKNAVFS